MPETDPIETMSPGDSQNDVWLIRWVARNASRAGVVVLNEGERDMLMRAASELAALRQQLTGMHADEERHAARYHNLRDALGENYPTAEEVVGAAVAAIHERRGLRQQLTEAQAEPIRYDQMPGGCWVACIAGLTRLPREDFERMVPRLPDGSIDGSMGTEYHNVVNAYLRANGWRLVHTGTDAPHGYSIGSGMSPRGIEHATIARGGVLWHDPHESRAGVVGGFTQFEIVVPLAAPIGDAWESLRNFAPACYEYAQERGVPARLASSSEPPPPTTET